MYALAEAALGLKASAMGFVSGNAWDAQAARGFGMRVFWCNRTGAPFEYELERTATVMDGLAALPGLV